MPTKPKTEKKQCTRCKKRKSVEDFYRDKYVKGGYSSWCKDCTREYDREYAKRKKEAKS